MGPDRHVVLAFITSAIPTVPEDTDIVIQSSHPDFAAMGLRGASAVRLHRLMTVSTAIIERELGELPADVSTDIGDAVKKLFGLS